jgi:type II secretory ATPase GspE/PulE/Tfp pilus assembly ATPase PilB-like protein
VADVEKDDGDEEFEDIEQVLLQGPLYGRKTNLKQNPRLVKAGLIPTKRMLSDALSRRAHTVILEPKGPRLTIRFVVDGIPYPAGAFSGKQGVAIVQMVKLLAGLDVQSRKEAQSGGIEAKFDDEQYRLLVDTTPFKGAVERLRIRVENVKESFIRPLDVDFPTELKETIQKLTDDASGIILACGPSGTGVTSLSMVALHCMDPYLYSVFNMTDVGDRQLVNVTDVDEDAGMDLEMKLDRLLRKEGEAVYMGKFDDPQRAQLLFDYSDRLCFFGEITARTPAEAVKQLIDWVGVDKVLSSLKGVISQKLIRRLCDDCKQAYRPNPKLLQQLGLPPETTVLYRPPAAPSDDEPDAPSVAELCEDCNGSPYHGRVPAYELFEMTDPMKEVIAEGGDAAAIRKQMVDGKHRMLQQDALRLVVSGATSLEELRRVFAPAKGKRRPMKRRPRPAAE